MQINYDRVCLVNQIPVNAAPIRIETKICRFALLIQSKKEIKEHCEKKTLERWMISKNEELKFKNISDYHGFIFPALKLTQTDSLFNIQSRTDTARRYANILDRYVPEGDGNIYHSFNYLQLVRVIKKVFKRHISNHQALFTRGIHISVKNESFYAKVEGLRICVFHDAAEMTLGKGAYGTVKAVYEIVSCTVLALKYAESQEGKDQLVQEVRNLYALHRRAQEEKKSLEGLQSTPLSTFNITDGLETKLVGYLSLKYDMDLFVWIRGARSKSDRIHVCKRILKAYEKKAALGYWHGDLKPSNILIDEKSKDVVIVDWAGSLTFKDAAIRRQYPGIKTDIYMNVTDRNRISKICANFPYDEVSAEEFIKAANDLELFSLGIVLYMTLVGDYPFSCYNDENHRVFPDSLGGVFFEPLIYWQYSEDIQITLLKMLAHHEKDRYSLQQVIAIWEKIRR